MLSVALILFMLAILNVLSPNIRIPTFGITYFILPVPFLRQFKYELEISNDRIIVKNDLLTRLVVMPWREVESIKITCFKKLKLTSMRDRSITIKRIIPNYEMVIIEIIQKVVSSNPNVKISNTTYRRLNKMFDRHILK